jgi:Fic family protein
METFRRLDHFFAQTPAALGRMLSEIDVARGRQEAFRRQNPAVLKTLTEVALVQSVEASNAIENIKAPHKRIEELVAEKTTPRNRSEEEIAGYRDALNTVHSSAEHIPVKPSILEQLHRDLYRFSAKPGGKFKSVPNEIEETRLDGTKRIRFQPVGVFETPGAVEELCTRFVEAREKDDYHPLLLTGAFVFDFLCIHPFADGNGRMSRLLTLLLLYQAGYEVGRFISLERLIDESKETYYDALEASTVGWHEGTHDLEPWTRYFLGIMIAAYEAFEQRAGTVESTRGAKRNMIHDFIRSRISDRFTVADVRAAVPSARDNYVGQVLRELAKEGAIELMGRGRNAEWRRIRSDF